MKGRDGGLGGRSSLGRGLEVCGVGFGRAFCVEKF